MRFFVLPILNGVIVDGPSILSGGCQHIEDGQNKKSDLLFSFELELYHFCILSAAFIRQKMTSFYWHHLNNNTPYMKINVSIQETKIIMWCSSCV